MQVFVPFAGGVSAGGAGQQQQYFEEKIENEFKQTISFAAWRSSLRLGGHGGSADDDLPTRR